MTSFAVSASESWSSAMHSTAMMSTVLVIVASGGGAEPSGATRRTGCAVVIAESAGITATTAACHRGQIINTAGADRTPATDAKGPAARSPPSRTIRAATGKTADARPLSAAQHMPWLLALKVTPDQS
jgi:hypothetical protein